MRLIQYVLLAFCLIHFSVTADDSIPKLSTNNARLQQIRLRFSEYPNIELPFSCNIQDLNKAFTNFYPNHENDMMIFGIRNTVSIIGTNRDTSNYFAFFYLVHGDVLVPGVVVYDKKGNLLNQQFLGKSCYQGCESACRSFVSISEDLEITFKYEEFLYTMIYDNNDDLVDCSKLPESASGFILTSKIKLDGTYEVLDRKMIEEEELLKNPPVRN